MDTNITEPSESGSGSTRGHRSGKNVHNPNVGLESDNSDRGKEKESEIRARVRDRDRVNNREYNLGLNNDRGAIDDDNDADNDSDGGGGGEVFLHQNLTSASGILHGLLMGLVDLPPSSAMASASSSHHSERLKKILSGLRADGEEGKQVEALTRLCYMLCIGTKDSLSTFSVESFVPVLVGLLKHESKPDIMLRAARALTYLCDALPSSCVAVVHYGAVSCFVARLHTIEYMDLAEQSLQALKKISQEHPTACLRAGALIAVLSNLDVFSARVQCVALSTAANMCKKFPSDAADFVMEAVPLLTNLLRYHDAKVSEHAVVCLTGIVESFAASPDKLDELCNCGPVTQAASLISTSSSGGGQTSPPPSTYMGLIQLLSTCASVSPLGTKTLMLLGISGIIKDILSGSVLVATMSLSPSLSRPPEQIYEIVNLTNELLPPLPQGMISLSASSNLFDEGSLSKKSPAGSSSKQEETSGGAPEISGREKLLTDEPQLLQQFGMDLLPVLIQMYASNVNASVRHKCLSVIGKLMYFSTADMIQSFIAVTNISSFLAGILAWKDPQVLLPSLQIAEILMEKLPETFSKLFVREGVVHAVETLNLSESSTDKDTDSTPGLLTCSRRYQLHVGTTSNSDVTTSEDPKNSPPNSLEVPNIDSSIRVAVSTNAKGFKDKYFPSIPGAVEVGVSDDLLRLKNLCVTLSAFVDAHKSKLTGKSKASALCVVDYSPTNEEDLSKVITEILSELTKGDGVSTFEFIGSGAVDALLNYLSFGFLSKEKVPESNFPKLRQEAIRRYKSFIAVTLPFDIDESNSVTPMSVLVQKLQNALTSLERFHIMLCHSSLTSIAVECISSALGTSSPLLKLRLCRGKDEKSLRDYSSNIVLMDPLASLAVVEDFLWPRVQTNSVGYSETGFTLVGARASSTPASTTCRQSTRSRSAISIGNSAEKDKHASSSKWKGKGKGKGKGKAVLKQTQDETRGPLTRNASRRMTASNKDKDISMKSVDNESTSKVVDSFPVCMCDVHDVRLEDPTDGAPAGPTTSDSYTNRACGFSANNRGIRADSDRYGEPLSGFKDFPRLVFSSNGKKLDRNITVYHAIQQRLVLAEGDDERHNDNDLLSSDDIYTVTYQKADTPSLINSKAGSTSNSNLDSPCYQMSPFDTLLRGELPCDLEKNDPTYNILALLRLLNQLAPRLRLQTAIDSYAEGKISSLNGLNNITGPRVSTDEFINGKLTPKLSRRIQDVFALCEGSVPSWCHQLTKACPFLFPFDT